MRDLINKLCSINVRDGLDYPSHVLKSNLRVIAGRISTLFNSGIDNVIQNEKHILRINDLITSPVKIDRCSEKVPLVEIMSENPWNIVCCELLNYFNCHLREYDPENTFADSLMHNKYEGVKLSLKL